MRMSLGRFRGEVMHPTLEEKTEIVMGLRS